MSAVLNLPFPVIRWRQATLALALLLAAILVLYRDTFAAMVGIWIRSDTFTHAFLVPPIVLWLIWRRREVLAACAPKPQLWMLLPMALVSAAWLFGDLAGSNTATQLSATVLLVLTVPTVLGWQATRQMAFPLAFLFFMVPIGEFLLPSMMESTADFAVAAVAMSGVPVYREGLNFVIPTGTWSVVEACSGVRYLIASVMVGTLFAYLNYSSLWRRLVFIGVSILVPILANWVRAYMIVMLGHLSGNKLAAGVDHIIYGWVFFGIVILLMFMIGARWAERELAPQLPALPAGAVAVSPAAAWTAALLAVAVVAAAPLAIGRADAARAPLTLLLPTLDGVRPLGGAQPLLAPLFPGAAAQVQRSYETARGDVTVHIAYFRDQGYGGKAVSSGNALMQTEDNSWSRASSNRLSAPNGAVPVLRVSELVSGNLSQRRRVEVRQVYWVGGRYTHNDIVATALGVWGRVIGKGDDAAVVTVYAEGTADDTGPRLDAFVASHLTALSNQLSSVQRQPRTP